MRLLSWFRRSRPRDLRDKFDAGRYGELSYRLSVPSGLSASSPLLVYLHGAGGAGGDNLSQLQRGSGYVLSRILEHSEPAFVLAPQCPRDQAWWSPSAAASRPGELLLDLVERLCREHPIDPARLYLMGVSMGGHGVWDLGWRRPDLWAALVPVCGATPGDRLGTLVKTPIWCLHGQLDGEVPVEGSRRAVGLLRSLGGSVVYTELEGIGHNCTREAFARSDLLPWVFASVARPLPGRDLETALSGREAVSLSLTASYEPGRP